MSTNVVVVRTPPETMSPQQLPCVAGNSEVTAEARAISMNVLVLATMFFLVSLLAAGCGGAGSSGSNTPIRSDDGLAELQVPEGALPSGVKLSDIKVTRVTDVETNSPVYAYKLEPEGTRFKEPVSLTLKTAVSGSRRPPAWAWLIAADGTLELIDTVTSYEAGLDKATVVARVPHFSWVTVSLDVDQGYPLYTVQLNAPDEAVVNEPFIAVVSSTWTSNDFRTPIGQYDYLKTGGIQTSGVFIQGSVLKKRFSGRFSADGATPSEIRDAPPVTDYQDRLTESRDFRCSDPGTAYVFYYATGEYEYSYTVGTVGGTVAGRTSTGTARNDLLLFEEVTCLSSAPTPTPTVTSAQPPRKPVVTAIQVTISVPVTTYSVTAEDPEGGTLSYQWKMSGEACGTPKVPWAQNGATVRWSHSNTPPDSCQHLDIDHDVNVSVTVTSSKSGSVQCVITGSGPRDIRNPGCQ